MTSQSGLFRFDGVHFDQSLSKRLPSQMVKGIFVDADGSLWLGYFYGGVSHVVGDRIDTYRDGLPLGTVFAFARTPDGTLWVASTGGLARLVHGAWHTVGADVGYSGRPLRDMSQSADGRLWITTTANEYLVLATGAARFEPVDRATILTQLWGLPPSTDQRLLDLVSTPFVDSAGALWLPSMTGLQRYRWTKGKDQPPTKEEFDKADGLTDTIPSGFFEDRESNVWVATALGIDQFRENRITPHEVDERLFMPTVAFDSDGVGWAGTMWGAFRLTPESTPLPELGQYFSCVTRDRLGNVWMAGQSGVFHIVHGEISKIAGPPTAPSEAIKYQSIAVDGKGAVWVALAGLGLFRRDGTQWTRLTTLAGLPTTHLTRLVGDAAGNLWVAFGDGHLVRMDGASVVLFDTSSGLDVGAVADMALDRANALVGGEQGLAQMIHGRFHPVRGRGEHVFSGISGLVQLRSGEVWMQADEGIVRIPSEDMRLVAVRPEYEVNYEVFDAEDGLIGKADKVRPLPSLVEGQDDRVWITTTREVASVNTRRLVRNLRPAKPAVMTVLAGGVLYRASDDMTLPAHTRNIRIDFGAPTLTMPTRTTFQAKLAGVDDRWQELGIRREAFYTNLGPGEYRFDLRVTNEDGRTSALDKPLVLHIAPAFYQTLAFRIGAGILAIALIVSLYQWRLALVSQKARIRLEERERIARELHDTLLQGAQALLYAVESVVRAESIDETARPILTRTLGSAREVVAEGRSRVRDLRQDCSDADCPLESYLEFLEDTGEGGFDAITIEGRIRRLKVERGQEVVAIIREALQNAVSHSRATIIRLHIRYGRMKLAIFVEDNGQGLPGDLLAGRRLDGHWGITGMRERASRLGGMLRLRSTAEQGTSVRLTVPARRIYRRRSR
ncbi:sensor histidine kinase [Luteibacter yeojuensis]|uniref:Histidine kinase domain-containing protein n=1 Tax=Luteibacter yeojuensis TaxID=345309 RepID=A0A7X5QV64_9GAMM|nr:sensor histidine kinase [Luteibacter yeojuensis]NID16012.1 hypothetical protein [Luteibacter yeojuensis]